MVLFNYSTRELTAKIVYYGPGLCGKTTNLQYIFDNLPGTVKGKMLSLATKTDRTLFFDFLPLDLGEIRGMKTRIQLYTVPGQVFYNETRRLVLKGADGVVFVADSQKQMLDANVDSYRNLEENLRLHSMRLSEIPLVMQFNKRDLPNLSTIEELNATMNLYSSPFYESVATTGIGVQDTLKAITKLVLLHLTKKYDTRKPDVVAATSPAGGHVAVSRPAARRETPRASAAQAGGAWGSESPTRPPNPAAAAGSGLEVPADEEIVDLTDEYDEAEDEAAFAGEEPVELTDEIDEPMAASAGAHAARGRPIEADEDEDEDLAPPPARPGRPAARPLAHAGSGSAPRGRAATNGGGVQGAGQTPAASSAGVELTLEEDAGGAQAPHAVPRLVVGEEQTIAIPIDVEIGGVTRRLTLSLRVLLGDRPRSS